MATGVPFNTVQKVDPAKITVGDGSVVTSDRAKWLIEKELGRGGFGCVFLVKNLATREQCAMKVEAMVTKKKEDERLQIETMTLEALRRKNLPHLMWSLDKGIDHNFKFMVMPLVGKSIDWLQEKMMEGKPFSRSTAIQIMIQMMEAIRDLHDLGFLHRDVKPANFATGLKDKHMIYMLDYGMCRYFRNTDGFLSNPRSKKLFCGTHAYCSRNMHTDQETCRKDDIECWFYVLFELLGNKAALRWMTNTKEDINDIYAAKQAFMEKGPRAESWNCMPQAATLIWEHIEKLIYYDRPDYDFILTVLHETDSIEKYCNLKETMDWMKPEIVAAYDKKEAAKAAEEEKKRNQW